MNVNDANFKTLLMALMIGGLVSSPRVFAEGDLDEDELVIVESVLEKNTPTRVRKAKPQQVQPRDSEFKNMSELSGLAPFNEISVLQKKFMPKSSRFEIHGGYNLIANNPFFNISGFQFKLGYYFSERLGIEAAYRSLVTSDSQEAKDLRSIQGVSTRNLSTVQSGISYSINYSPVYGKISWFDKKIIPFDHFFTLGYAITQTQNENVGGIQLGTGQLFSWSKSVGFRWDIVWNSYTATTSIGVSNTVQDLYVSAGVSYFFPEANYR